MDFHLEPAVYDARRESPLNKRVCTMPNVSSRLDGLSSVTPPRRAETFPSTHIEELNREKNKRLLRHILSKIEPDSQYTSPDREAQLASHHGDEYPSNVAQSCSTEPELACEEWPVPTFFLNPTYEITSPALDRADGLTPDDLESSPKPLGPYLSQELAYSQVNDYCTMPEDLDSIAPIEPTELNHRGNKFHHPPTISDSGVGSSILSYSRHKKHSLPSPSTSFRHPQSLYSREGT